MITEYHNVACTHYKKLSAKALWQLELSQPYGHVRRAHDLNVSKREIHLIEVKHCENTWLGHQFKAFTKLREILCMRSKDDKVILHTVFLGVRDSIYTSYT